MKKGINGFKTQSFNKTFFAGAQSFGNSNPITWIRRVPSQIRFAVLSLVRLALYFIAHAYTAAQDQIPASAATKKLEESQVNSWDEPALFPAQTVEPSGSIPAIKRARHVSSADLDPTAQLDRQESGDGNIHLAEGLQSNGRNSPIESSGLGFAASRERDAILARIQSETSYQPYNIKIGGIPFRLSGSLDLEFSDNIDRVSKDSEAEFTILPRLNISGSVKLASKTSLNIGLGVGYIKYLNHGENDRLLTLASLTPDTGVSLNIKAGKFIVSIYDRPSVPQYQSDFASQRNQTQYNQFTNTAGLSILWGINTKSDISLRYSHSTAVSLGSENNSTDGGTDSFLAALSCQLSESLGVGFQGSVDVRSYSSNLLNSGTSYAVGIFASSELSRFLRIRGSFGYQGGDYGSSGHIGDSSSLGTYYTTITLFNNLNSHISHSLSVGREAQQGSFSNFTVNNYLKYQANWNLVSSVGFNGWASFEDIDESGGLFAQHFQYYSTGAACSFSLSSHTSLSLTYAYSRRLTLSNGNNNNGILDFTENRISLSIGYAF